MSLEKIIYKENSDLSKKIDKQKVPEHVAIIMDGNGRWATKKGYHEHLDIIKELAYLKKLLKYLKN